MLLQHAVDDELHKPKSCAFDRVAAASRCSTTCVCCMITSRVQPFVDALPLHAVGVESTPNTMDMCARACCRC